MKLNTVLFPLAAIAACICVGCGSPDKSGDTQQMPVASKPSAQSTGVPTANLPPAAAQSMQNAAAKK